MLRMPKTAYYFICNMYHVYTHTDNVHINYIQSVFLVYLYMYTAYTVYVYIYICNKNTLYLRVWVFEFRLLGPVKVFHLNKSGG